MEFNYNGFDIPEYLTDYFLNSFNDIIREWGELCILDVCKEIFGDLYISKLSIEECVYAKHHGWKKEFKFEEMFLHSKKVYQGRPTYILNLPEPEKLEA